MKRTIKGFTIVELIVVISIIGILAAIGIVSYSSWQKSIAASQIKSDLNGVSSAMENSRSFNSVYPSSIPSTFKSSTGILLTGGSIDDGRAYCVSGFNEKYPTVIYHIDTFSNNKDTQEGACPLGSFVALWGGASTESGSSVIQTSDGGYVVVGNTTNFGAGSNDVLLAKYDSSGTLSWNKTWGGAGTDYGFSVIQTSDGGYFVRGRTASYGAGNNDILLLKYDSAGNLSWNKTWGGVSADNGAASIQTTDGGFVVLSTTTDFGAGGNDLVLVKFDSSGNFLWNQTWGGTGFDYAMDQKTTIKTNDGGFAIVIYTNGFGAGSYDGVFIKYDSAGNISWNKTWGGASADVITKIIQTTDGGYVLMGDTVSYGAGTDDMVLIKFDSAGKLLWNTTWGCPSAISAPSIIIQTTDGGYAIAGYSSCWGAGGRDLFLSKYTSNGTLSWNKMWGGPNTGEMPTSLIQTTDGGFVVSSNTPDYGAGGGDVLLAKYDSNGTLLWNKTWGGTGADYGASLTSNREGGFFLTGSTASYGAGLADMYLAKFKSDGSINNCSLPMCQSPSITLTTTSATITYPTATVNSNPSVTVTNPSATVTSPSATVTSPSATSSMLIGL